MDTEMNDPEAVENLEQQLVEADAAEAPPIAEAIAAHLGDALDATQPGTHSDAAAGMADEEST